MNYCLENVGILTLPYIFVSLNVLHEESIIQNPRTTFFLRKSLNEQTAAEIISSIYKLQVLQIVIQDHNEQSLTSYLLPPSMPSLYTSAHFSNVQFTKS